MDQFHSRQEWLNLGRELLVEWSRPDHRFRPEAPRLRRAAREIVRALGGHLPRHLAHPVSHPPSQLEMFPPLKAVPALNALSLFRTDNASRHTTR